MYSSVRRAAMKISFLIFFFSAHTIYVLYMYLYYCAFACVISKQTVNAHCSIITYARACLPKQLQFYNDRNRCVCNFQIITNAATRQLLGENPDFLRCTTDTLLLQVLKTPVFTGSHVAGSCLACTS